MTFRDLYNVTNTDTPRVTMYDSNGKVIYKKDANKMIVRMRYWDYTIDRIVCVKFDDIILYVSKPTN